MQLMSVFACMITYVQTVQTQILIEIEYSLYAYIVGVFLKCGPITLCTCYVDKAIKE